MDDDKFDNNSYEEISKTIDKRIKQIEDISNHLKRIVGIVENKDLALIIKWINRLFIKKSKTLFRNEFRFLWYDV